MTADTASRARNAHRRQLRATLADRDRIFGDDNVEILLDTFHDGKKALMFAVNPLGQKVFSNGKEELNLSLAPHASVTFRYRILITSAIATPEATETAYEDFAAAYP